MFRMLKKSHSKPSKPLTHYFQNFMLTLLSCITDHIILMNPSSNQSSHSKTSSLQNYPKSLSNLILLTHHIYLIIKIHRTYQNLTQNSHPPTTSHWKLPPHLNIILYDCRTLMLHKKYNFKIKFRFGIHIDKNVSINI